MNVTHAPKVVWAFLLCLLFISQGCQSILSFTPPPGTPTLTVSLTATNTPRPTKIPTTTSIPTITLTPVPHGVFVLFFYEPLIMEYDPSMWEDRSNYAEWGINRKPATGTILENYLQAKDLRSCAIGVQGPTDFQEVAPEKVQLGDIHYQVISFLEKESVSAFYIEDHSLSEYNYEYGLPIPVIQAGSSEWNECKAMAEDVLSTLRVP